MELANVRQEQICQRPFATDIQYATQRSDQHRDQLLQDYEARVWTADEAKTPCEEHLGSEHFQEMQ